MDTTTKPHTDDDPQWEEYDEPAETQLPVRPRRRFLNGPTVFLIALITAAGGFYAGVRVQKSQTTSSGAAFAGAAAVGGGSSATASRLRSLFASRFGGGTAASGATGAAGAAAAGGFPAGGFAGRFGGAGGGTAGTVSSVDGHTIYLQESSGNTVKVLLNAATTVTKSETVSKQKINPGDTITASGQTKSNGSIVATAVTDSGSSSGGSGAAASGAGGAAAGGAGGAAAGGGGGLASLFSAGG